MDLFDHAMKDRIAREAPLAARVRKKLSEKTAFFGVLSRQIAFSLLYSSGGLPEPEKPP